jgi:hypothetical protein
MTDSKTSRLPHIGGCEKIDIQAGFDLLAHQTGRPEFRRRNRISASRKTAEQIRKGVREATGAHDS